MPNHGFYFCYTEGVVNTTEKFAEQMLFAFINMCTQLQLTKTETLQIVHTVLFKDIMEDKFREEDFIRKTGNLTV
jgi:hypothetical protein